MSEEEVPDSVPDSVTFQTGVLMGLARVYDALLTLIAQSDDETAAMLQDAHAKGYYLFPGFTREDETPPSDI